ncbi:hypothetical protein HO133_002311 [Letharia lupina]|uniref:Uncharacterized protein n=1 Tax=Letharia lupina TaxID=560253 RepID=A0A8H6CDK5_9LECA|nr:uncharacterized protein HO133_002311 [Letharia lupina]KAF6221455.1 hypothetical protein HO133_002311 [Letharia lupina]
MPKTNSPGASSPVMQTPSKRTSSPTGDPSAQLISELRASVEKPKSEPKDRIIRTPKSRGTNVHSGLAGISVTNAMMREESPPTDAAMGSRHHPWLHLTSYELLTLRKRMKKNAIWKPSETMVAAELIDLGRGFDNYLAAKKQAEAEGTEFVDEANIASTKPELFINPTTPGGRPINRGMVLNAAKKRKREGLSELVDDQKESLSKKVLQSF